LAENSSLVYRRRFRQLVNQGPESMFSLATNARHAGSSIRSRRFVRFLPCRMYEQVDLEMAGQCRVRCTPSIAASGSGRRPREPEHDRGTRSRHRPREHVIDGVRTGLPVNDRCRTPGLVQRSIQAQPDGNDRLEPVAVLAVLAGDYRVKPAQGGGDEQAIPVGKIRVEPWLMAWYFRDADCLRVNGRGSSSARQIPTADILRKHVEGLFLPQSWIP
jgi:hypothetical protein